MGPLVSLLGGGAASGNYNAGQAAAAAPQSKFQVDPTQYANTIGAAQNYAAQGLGANQGIQNQESALGQMLTAQANGGGPNPALAQLQQTTAANNNQAQGQIASTRGINPALAAKMGANIGAENNQQAAGQAATLRAQQMLAAQSQLGGILGQQAGQNIAGQQAATGLIGTAGGLQGQQNQLNQQTAAQNAANQLGAQQIAAGLSSQDSAAGAGILGGIFQGAGAAAGLGKAAGGVIPGYADGTPDAPVPDINPQPQGGTSPLHMYMAGLDSSYLKPPTANISPGKLQGPPPNAMYGSGSDPAAGQLSSKMLGINQPLDPAAIMRNGTSPSTVQQRAGAGLEQMGNAMMQGNPAGAYNRFAQMHLAGSGAASPMMANGGSIFTADGGVPGEASVKGDSKKNDKVPAMLSPGEIVIPRSIAQSPDAAKKSHDFVQHLMQRSGGGYSRVIRARGYAEGGETPTPPPPPPPPQPSTGSVVDKVKGWFTAHQGPAVNENERKQFSQLKDYSEGGIVEATDLVKTDEEERTKIRTARGVGSDRHRKRITRVEKPTYSAAD